MLQNEHIYSLSSIGLSAMAQPLIQDTGDVQFVSQVTPSFIIYLCRINTLPLGRPGSKHAAATRAKR